MKTIFQILTYVCVVVGLGLGILLKDLRVLGIGIILGIMFWALDFSTYKIKQRE